MIPSGLEIFVALDPVNLHLSFDRLSGLAKELTSRRVRGEAALFVFFNRRRTALKALFFDGTGLCIFYKRLDRGRFQLPQPIDEGRLVVELSEEELDALLDGIELPRERGRGRKADTPTVH